jgi:hypothetical protein
MPLAKSAQVSEPVAPITDHPEPKSLYIDEGIPIDLYHYFSLELQSLTEKDKEKLRDIYSWASDIEEPTMGNILEKISRLEGQIGLSGFDKRYDKVWNWVSITRKINDLEKQREAYRKRWL